MQPCHPICLLLLCYCRVQEQATTRTVDLSIFTIRYIDRLTEAGIEPSVGSKRDSYDNALAETINGLYKTELIYPRGPWKTRESVEIATLQWVHWFNHQRLLESIGYIPPVEAEAQYWRLTATQVSNDVLL